MSSQILREAFFTNFHEEAAPILETFDIPDILRILQGTSAQNATNLLAAMSPQTAADVLAAMPTELRTRILSKLSPNTAASLLLRIEEEMRLEILSSIPEQHAADIRLFMEYPPESVGSLMDPHVMALPEDWTVHDAMAQVRTRAPKDIPDLYVIDRNQVLVGKLSLHDLLLVDPNERLQAVMHRDVPSIHPLESREQIMALFSEQPLSTIPVTDLDGHLLGVIRSAHIIKASQEEATADLQTMVGANKDERALSPIWFSVRKRLPWLQINLLTAFLAAFVVGLFEETIAQFTALAVLLPIVAGQSGNTGAQSLAVVIRGLTLRDIQLSQWRRVCWKEVSVAFWNGLAVSVVTALAVFVWSQSPGLALVIGMSMILSMVTAGLSGSIIPIMLKALNQDPAQSSSIILTTVTDVSGFFSFLGLATIFSRLLQA
ncbi:MAG: magnesium transporter [Nitrospirae bacterium]|nr:MAG: magnesium transporter [Nitrospirota bacterium]